MRWQYFSQIVKKYNKLEDFRRKEFLSFIASGNEIGHIVGIDDFMVLIFRLEMFTEERFYVMDDGNGYLRLSQFVKWHFKNGPFSEHRAGTGSDVQFEADRKQIGFLTEKANFLVFFLRKITILWGWVFLAMARCQ